MAGERTIRRKKNFIDEEIPVSEPPLNGFRRPPDAEDLSPEQVFEVAVLGAQKWIRSNERFNWDKVAEKACELYLTGTTNVDEICAVLDIPKELFEDNVDLPKIKAFIDGAVAKRIYEGALHGDSKLLQFIAERKLGWKKETKLEIEGEISVRPILNISLLTPEEESRLRRGLPAVPAPGEEDDVIEGEVVK